MSGPMVSTDRFAPPKARIAEPAASGAVELATRGSRFSAALIDMVVIFAIGFLLMWLARTLLPRLNPIVATLLPFLGFMAVNLVLLLRHGQTIGKRIVGIRIVRPDGRRVGAGRLIGLRYLLNGGLSLVPVVGVFYAVVDPLFIFGARRRCLHDLIADTIVVRT